MERFKGKGKKRRACQPNISWKKEKSVTCEKLFVRPRVAKKGRRGAHCFTHFRKRGKKKKGREEKGGCVFYWVLKTLGFIREAL